MIRFVIEKFRTAPGPLKEPRLILADLAEEILNTALDYMGKTPAAHSDFAPSPPFEGVRPAGSDRGESEHAGPTAPEEDDSETDAAVEAPLTTRELEIDPRLARAAATRANAHKQDFKVLAILWDAYQRGLVPLSAKAVSNHGEKIGLAIRHENVRKVVRMRLEKYVDFHNEGAGSGTIYRYVLNATGREHFAATYLRESER
jgi:hypothetical protein